MKTLFKMSLIGFFAIALGLLTACGAKEKVATDIVDGNQSVSRTNAQLNANRYKNAAYPNAAQILMASDSTISSSCRYGDGWASGQIISTSGAKIGEVKCQTNGSGKGIEGCMTKEEFMSKDYKNEEGTCNGTLTALEKFK